MAHKNCKADDVIFRPILEGFGFIVGTNYVDGVIELNISIVMNVAEDLNWMSDPENDLL